MSSQPREGGDPDQQARLRDIFETVTGTSEFVEEQAREETTAHGVADANDDVSTYVSAMVREDGLGETLDGPSAELTPD